MRQWPVAYCSTGLPLSVPNNRQLSIVWTAVHCDDGELIHSTGAVSFFKLIHFQSGRKLLLALITSLPTFLSSFLYKNTYSL